MTIRSLLVSSLRHHRALNALVIAGVAVAVAVLAGALLVGASVRGSLRELALGRLGNTDVVVSSTSTFRSALATEVTSPDIVGSVALLAVQGAVEHTDSGRTAARVQVFAIDDRFLAFHGRSGEAPRERDAWVSPALAAELQATAGDDLVLRTPKLTAIPLSHLQGRRDDTSERIRLTLTAVAARAQLGDFSLLPSQGPALTMIVPLSRLQRDLELPEQANTLLLRLVRPVRDAVADVRAALAPAVQLADLGFRVRSSDASPTSPVTLLESRSGLLPEAVWRPAWQRALDHGGRPTAVLTYLATSIRAGGREIPYSLVAATSSPRFSEVAPDPPASPPIFLNDWAANDLVVQAGDRVELDYLLWSDQEGLQSRSATFTFAGTVPMSGDGGDATFTPEYPGITNAEDVTSWDPPFPVDMQRVRKQDEEYWDRWGAAPKAFIPLAVGQRLWPSPFGNLSSLRTTATGDWPTLPALDAALQVRDVRSDALAAAAGTTDFGEYFVYFSFFLMVSGLLLAGMFFALLVEQRARDIGLLQAVGFTPRQVRRLLLGEAALLSVVGGVLGTFLAVGYAAVIMHGLRTWWVGAVNTTELRLHVDVLSLVGGALAAMLVAAAALALAFRRVSQQSTRALLLGGVFDAARDGDNRARFVTWFAIGAATALLAFTLSGLLPQTAGFFGAGGALLVGGCAAFLMWLRRPAAGSPRPSVTAFGASYARWRPTRSVLSAALIAFACFVIVSVAAFRRDDAGTSMARDGGTGGYALLAEAEAPLMHDPNTAAGRDELSLAGYPELANARISRWRLRPGDEASCLTLYRPANPRIVAPEAAFLAEGRFAFAASLATTDDERRNPWLLLKRHFDDGAIPAIVDHTSLTYVFHQALGEDVILSGDRGEPLRLRVVATLADSVLQSEVIIGEEAFRATFPTREGYRVWLVETPEAQRAALTTVLEDRLSDFGVDVIDTRARLAAYHQVENTYLSTFQALGALGLLLGTVGLGAVLARNVFERRRELALLSAVGFTGAHLRRLVTAESLLLVGTGVGVGTLAALLAVAPIVRERGAQLPWLSLLLLIAAVIGTSLGAALLATRLVARLQVVETLKSE